MAVREGLPERLRGVVMTIQDEAGRVQHRDCRHPAPSDTLDEEAVAGILNVDKPPQVTSHDVVQRIRRASKQRRVGHAGTLDPLATGVLLVCLGKATRVAEYLVDGRKRYRARAVLGVATDTYDREGKVTSRVPCPELNAADLEAVLQTFLGRTEQVPPMYSAVKVNGHPLYRLARNGMTVERKARPIEVYEIQLLEWSLPELVFELECSRGTYVRSLVHDLGQSLACGAHLTELTRLSSGSFRLEDSVSLEVAERSFADGSWRDLLHPIDEALLSIPAVKLTTEEALSVGYGQRIRLREPVEGKLCRAYGPEGRLVALLRPDGATGFWRPHKVFRPSTRPVRR